MHETTYPCIGILRVRGGVHMDCREPQRRCCWRLKPLPDEALYKQAAVNSRNPPAYSLSRAATRATGLTVGGKCLYPPRAHADYDSATLSTSKRHRVHEALQIKVPLRQCEPKGYATRQTSKLTSCNAGQCHSMQADQLVTNDDTTTLRRQTFRRRPLLKMHHL